MVTNGPSSVFNFTLPKPVDVVAKTGDILYSKSTQFRSIYLVLSKILYL